MDLSDDAIQHATEIFSRITSREPQGDTIRAIDDADTEVLVALLSMIPQRHDTSRFIEMVSRVIDLRISADHIESNCQLGESMADVSRTLEAVEKRQMKIEYVGIWGSPLSWRYWARSRSGLSFERSPSTSWSSCSSHHGKSTSRATAYPVDG